MAGHVVLVRFLDCLPGKKVWGPVWYGDTRVCGALGWDKTLLSRSMHCGGITRERRTHAKS